MSIEDNLKELVKYKSNCGYRCEYNICPCYGKRTFKINGNNFTCICLLIEHFALEGLVVRRETIRVTPDEYLLILEQFVDSLGDKTSNLCSGLTCSACSFKKINEKFQNSDLTGCLYGFERFMKENYPMWRK